MNSSSSPRWSSQPSASAPSERSSGDLDALNRSILAAVNERGRIYLSNATLNGTFALRACITNHRTTEEDLDTVIDEVTSVAVSLTED